LIKYWCTPSPVIYGVGELNAIEYVNRDQLQTKHTRRHREGTRETSAGHSFTNSEDCFYYCSERNNVVVLFGTLKVHSFILTEVSDCGLLIVVTSSTFLKRKDMLKEKSC